MDAIAVLALFLGLVAFPLSLYAIIKVKAWELSTHRVEYIKDMSPAETQIQAEQLAKPPQVFEEEEEETSPRFIDQFEDYEEPKL